MIKLDDKIIEKIYAGWLGKLIGIRSGAPIEMWSDEEIFNKYGEIDGYPEDYVNFGADDDSNGNIFALQTFIDFGANVSAIDFGQTMLNYAPFEHGYFWWGGYGISEEHTAYLNMHNGVTPPKSGSIELNGKELAQQIGGQIFSDIYGLICPNNPKKAASLARMAAQATHDGEAIIGGEFVASCISAAFKVKSVDEMINVGLKTIDNSSQYAKTVIDIIEFYNKNPKDYKECLKYIKQNYWKDKFGGNCHIIPNIAIMILALKYGEGSFDRSVNICNMCGFDTDCNTSNIATMLGVLNGLEAIDYKKWREPINDITVGSSVLGSMNLIDAAEFALKLVRVAKLLTNAEVEGKYKNLVELKNVSHFELSGSTHGFVGNNARIENSSEDAFNSTRSLRIEAKDGARVYKRTYFRAKEMFDNRYDPAFTPMVFAGQTIACKLKGGNVRLYARDCNSENVFYSDYYDCKDWTEVRFSIPKDTKGVCICEVGIEIEKAANIFLDDFVIEGNASYKLDFSKERIEYYTLQHQEVSQCTYYKGFFRLEDGFLSASCGDTGELYTGGDFKDIKLTAVLKPIEGDYHKILFNVQGALRCYSAGFCKDAVVLEKKQGGFRHDDIGITETSNFGYKMLAKKAFKVKKGQEYEIRIETNQGKILVFVDGELMISYEDKNPYLSGQIGVGVHKCSHSKIKYFLINQ